MAIAPTIPRIAFAQLWLPRPNVLYATPPFRHRLGLTTPGGLIIHPSSHTPSPSPLQLHIAEAQFSLHPGEALVEVLRVTPRLPGWLRITGVAWTLNGTAHGRIAFDVKGRKRKRPKGTR